MEASGPRRQKRTALCLLPGADPVKGHGCTHVHPIIWLGFRCSASHSIREGKRRGGSTWWVLVAGEETKESLSTWPRAAAAQQSSERVGRQRERENEEGRGMQRTEGEADGEKKNARASCGPFFSFFENLCFFFFLSLLIFYSCWFHVSILFIGHYQWLVQHLF